MIFIAYFNYKHLVGMPIKMHSFPFLFQYPWQVSLQISNSEGTMSHFCGASVISRRFLLTARNCFEGDKNIPRDMKAWDEQI